MPNYLLFLHADPHIFDRASPEEIQSVIQKYAEWKKRMVDAGVLTGGQKLQGGTGKVLRRVSGRTSVIDGPYTESKEVIAGLFEILADAYEHAVAVAGDCPHLEYGTIEIREVETGPASVAGETRAE